MALEPYWCSAELQKAINPQHQVRIVKQSLRECFFFCPLMLGLRHMQEEGLTHTYAVAAQRREISRHVPACTSSGGSNYSLAPS